MVLNEIYPMHSDELTGEATAELLVKCLKRTLWLSEEEIQEKLEHVVYDGVYEETENRVRGGGSLCLVSHLTDQLKLGPGVITGTWDYGHIIQLVLKDVLLDGDSSDKYQACTSLMYNLMAKYKDHKAAMIFKETANELNMAILKNQKQSDTRWARSDLSSKVAFFRNAPTFFIVLGREAEEHRRNRNNTKLKQVLKIMRKLQDPSFWLYAIGYTQILDIVSVVSVVGQSSSSFPTTVYSQLLDTIQELSNLGKSMLNVSYVCFFVLHS